MIFNFISILLILFTIFYVVNSNRKGYLISLHYILTTCFFIFICLLPLSLQTEIVFDEDFNLIILFAFLGLIFSLRIIPYDIFDPDTINYRPIKRKFKLNKSFLNFCFYAYLCYLIFGILNVIIQSGSISGVFIKNRLEDGLGVDYLGGNLVAILMNFFKYVYYIKIYIMFTNGNKNKFYFFYMIPLIHHQFTAITRFDFVVMAIVLLLIVIDSNRLKKISTLKPKKISTLKLIFWTFPLIISVLFYMRTANYARSGFFSDTTTSAEVSTNISGLASSALADLNYYNALHDLYEHDQKNTTTKEYGLSWFYYPFVNFVPRTLWPNKPLTAFSPRLTEQIYWKIGPGRPVATFTIFGEGYFQFGLLGVFFAPLFFVYTRYYSIKYIKKFVGSKIVVYLIIFSMITYFRGEQPIFHVLLDLLLFKIIQTFFSRTVEINPKLSFSK